jgi:hypothetical protein
MEKLVAFILMAASLVDNNKKEGQLDWAHIA